MKNESQHDTSKTKLSEDAVMKLVEAVNILYKSVVSRKIKERLDVIKNGKSYGTNQRI